MKNKGRQHVSALAGEHERAIWHVPTPRRRLETLVTCPEEFPAYYFLIPSVPEIKLDPVNEAVDNTMNMKHQVSTAFRDIPGINAVYLDKVDTESVSRLIVIASNVDAALYRSIARVLHEVQRNLSGLRIGFIVYSDDEVGWPASKHSLEELYDKV